MRFLLVLMASAALFLPIQGQGTARRMRLMTYNVENLFDTLHTVPFDDESFTPQGEMHWTQGRYFRKLGALARVILTAGGDEVPAVVGLCEVEGDSVLSDLLHRTRLAACPYAYAMTHGADARGMNVAAVYDTLLFRFVSAEAIRIPHDARRERPTRDVLHLALRTPVRDTLDVFVCHLPSRRGGASLTDAYRLRAARCLRTAADSVMRERRSPNVVLMGDFNAPATDAVFTEGLACKLFLQPPETERHLGKTERHLEKTERHLEKTARHLEKTARHLGETGSLPAQNDTVPQEIRAAELYLLSHSLAGRGDVAGSYKYRGRWEQLDHFIVCGAMLQKKPAVRLTTGEGCCRLGDFAFLLEESGGESRDARRESLVPRRTYLGPTYHGGLSDHLPVLLDIWW